MKEFEIFSYESATNIVNKIENSYSVEDVKVLLKLMVGNIATVKDPIKFSIHNIMDRIINIFLSDYDEKFINDGCNNNTFYPLYTLIDDNISWAALIMPADWRLSINDSSQSKITPLLFMPFKVISQESINFYEKNPQKLFIDPKFDFPLIIACPETFQDHTIKNSGAWVCEMSSNLIKRISLLSSFDIDSIKIQHRLNIQSLCKIDNFDKDNFVETVTVATLKINIIDLMNSIIASNSLLDLKFLLGCLNQDERQNFSKKTIEENHYKIKYLILLKYKEIIVYDYHLYPDVWKTSKELKVHIPSLIKSLRWGTILVAYNVLNLFDKLATESGINLGYNLKSDFWINFQDISNQCAQFIKGELLGGYNNLINNIDNKITLYKYSSEIEIKLSQKLNDIRLLQYRNFLNVVRHTLGSLLIEKYQCREEDVVMILTHLYGKLPLNRIIGPRGTLLHEAVMSNITAIPAALYDFGIDSSIKNSDLKLACELRFMSHDNFIKFLSLYNDTHKSTKFCEVIKSKLLIDIPVNSGVIYNLLNNLKAIADCHDGFSLKCAIYFAFFYGISPFDKKLSFDQSKFNRFQKVLNKYFLVLYDSSLQFIDVQMNAAEFMMSKLSNSSVSVQKAQDSYNKLLGFFSETDNDSVKQPSKPQSLTRAYSFNSYFLNRTNKAIEGNVIGNDNNLYYGK